METLSQAQESNKPTKGNLTEQHLSQPAGKRNKEITTLPFDRAVERTVCEGPLNTRSIDPVNLKTKEVAEAKYDSQLGKLNEEKSQRKKIQPDLTEVLPNRSWVTNFYHNYTKAVERADLNSLGSRPKIEKPAEASKEPTIIKPEFVVDSPFKSILFVKPVTHQPDRLKQVKPDLSVIASFKEILSENQERDRQKDLQRAIAPGATTQKLEPYQQNKYDQSIKLKGAKPVDEPIKGDKSLFTLTEVPVKQFEKLGVTQEHLLRTGILDKLLRGEKTPIIENLQIDKGGGQFMKYSASFQLDRKPDGTVGVKVNYLPEKQALKIPDRIAGKEVNDDMKRTLQEKQAVPLSREIISGQITAMLVVDNVKNSIKVVSPIALKVPKEIKGVKLTEDQQANLREGKSIQLAGLTAKDNKTKFNATVNIDLTKNSLRFTNAVPVTAIRETSALKERITVSKVEGRTVEETSHDVKPTKNVAHQYKEDSQKQQSKGVRI